MQDVLEFENRFYILAGSSLTDQRTLVLKSGDTFAIFNPSGDIESIAGKAQGVFTDGMRFLSRLETRLNGLRPILLSSAVSHDGSRILVDLTNPDIAEGDHLLPHGTVHLRRTKSVGPGAVFERLVLGNFGPRPLQATVTLTFEADFADIFEVRGTKRERRGRRHTPVVLGPGAIAMDYEGLDGIQRRAFLEFSPPPQSISPTSAQFVATIEPGRRTELAVVLRCTPTREPAAPGHRRNIHMINRRVEEAAGGSCRIRSSNEKLNGWLDRSLADVQLLTSQTGAGEYPYAGVPWYSTPFGRDGIITALQMLWVNPDLARGVLEFLARFQASEYNAARDAEPGKILHEFRTDEMSNLGEVPFGRYYGTVDATPLFVMLAGEYFKVTGDAGFIRTLWPHIERALEWIDRDGDHDQDGFVEYSRKSGDGLDNQGWKDSHDAVFHADGTLATPPIALCEVQGYVYRARTAAVEMARALGDLQRAEVLDHQAAGLKRRFNEAFWIEPLGTFAIALDRGKQPCAVRTSNPGHCLWTGIVDEALAPRLAQTLMARDSFSGWGIRTVATGQHRYNPMSYHDGSVWPHDNAICAAGIARYGIRDHPLTLFNAWMAAAGYLELFRLPELICGFRRQPASGPTQYPVACSPQAWAAGASFMMLAACLGLTIDGARAIVSLRRPTLPRSLKWLTLRNLRVGAGRVDLLLHREGDDVGVLVQRRQGEVTVQVEK